MADLGIHIWGGKLLRGPEGRERGCGQLGVWGAVRALLAGSGGSPSRNRIWCLFSLKI